MDVSRPSNLDSRHPMDYSRIPALDSRSTMDLSTLIQTAQRGDLDSFNQLVLSHQDLVYNHAYYFFGEREAAEDATQEVFLRAFRKIHTFRGGSFRAWLLRIAANICYDELRRRKRTPSIPLSTLASANQEEIEPLERLAAWHPAHQQVSIEEQVERRDQYAALKRSLANLPPEYRNTALLVDVLGFDYAEAAASLGVPEGTVKSRLSRARKALRDRLVS